MESKSSLELPGKERYRQSPRKRLQKSGQPVLQVEVIYCQKVVRISLIVVLSGQPVLLQLWVRPPVQKADWAQVSLFHPFPD